MLAHPGDRAQRREEVGVAGAAGGVEVHAVGAGREHAVADEDHVLGGQLHGVLDGGARAGDVAAGQQLEPVVGRAVRLRVERQVGLRPVLDRRRQHELGVLHDLLLERQDRLDGLVGVLDVPELEDVLAQALFALEQVEDVGAGHLAAAAVAGEHDLVADVDRRERAPARRRCRRCGRARPA